MTSCIAGKKIRAMGPGPLELFPFVVLAILMAMAGVLVSICSLHGLVFLNAVKSLCAQYLFNQWLEFDQTSTDTSSGLGKGLDFGVLGLIFKVTTL